MSSGRASTAIALVETRRDFVVIEQSARVRRRASPLDFGAEPVIVVNRIGEKVESYPIDRLPGLRGYPTQFRFKLGRNL